MNNEKELNAYLGEINEIAELLKNLKSHIVDNHMDVSPESVNFGNLGSAKHLKELLKEAAAFACVTE